MTTTPQGWYPDPSAPGTRGLRWWDGTRWTEHASPGVAPLPFTAAGVPTTPDGVVLAGWGRRLAATLVDGVIAFVLTVALGFGFLRAMAAAFRDYVDAAIRAADNSQPAPSSVSLYTDHWQAFLGFAAVGLLVNVAYQVGFLKALSATPGKLLLGMRVRLRETPGPLAWSTVWRHWFAQQGYALIGWVPIVGTVLAVYPLIDGLWPLWDERRQALHDKFARTNVVRR